MVPKAICLEDLATVDEDERYLCCAVEVGDAPGLSVDNRGQTQWLIDDDVYLKVAEVATAMANIPVDLRQCMWRERPGGRAQVSLKLIGR